MNTVLIDKLRIQYPNYSIEGNKSSTMAVVVTNTQRLYYALDINNEPFLNFARPINNLSNTAI